mmetsp:Transcript_19676/g.51025  ORF Transcript_19676/g.51025 Transcript_19676/m.51025 type:complete len:88 (-) Transcript_19676:535-798(-)
MPNLKSTEQQITQVTENCTAACNALSSAANKSIRKQTKSLRLLHDSYSTPPPSPPRNSALFNKFAHDEEILVIWSLVRSCLCPRFLL